MSISDTSDKSYETTSDNQDGESSSVDQPSARQSRESQKAERGPAEEQRSGKRLAEHQGKDDAAEEDPEASAKEGHSSKRQSRLKAPTYRHILNEIIDDVAGRTRNYDYQLGPSQIGASFWTASEKDALFRELALCGTGDLRSLSAAVGTKSEPEIHVYLKLLQDGVVEADATLPSRQKLSASTSPAAYEVGVPCEAELELAADSLGRSLAKHDAQAEQDRYPEHWLIDAELADEIEQIVEDDELSPKAKADVTNEEAGSEPETNGVSSVPFPSASLLRPAAFLQLIYDIYMAGTPGDDSRWYASGENVDGLDEPAIFRSAFEDFYNIAVSLTRRLVQATIFQTMTRLRASDSSRMSWTPEPLVQAKDVRTALDNLGMDVGAWSKYWAQLPRRQGLIVYSDAAKYRDGRPGTKTGVGLSYEEVEAELGLSDVVEPGHDLDHMDNVSLDEMDFDSDDFTVISESDSETGADGDGNIDAEASDALDQGHNISEDAAEREAESQSNRDLTLRERQWATRKSKRKRALSPISFGRAQDAYIDAKDLNASREEEQRLWQSIRKQPPDDVQLDPQAMPEVPVLNGDLPAQTTNWRDKVQYEAPWERFGGSVDVAEFREMERCGRLGRKRRRVLREKMLEEGGVMSDVDLRAGEVEDADEASSAEHECSALREDLGAGSESEGNDD